MESSMATPCDASRTCRSLVLRLEKFPAAFRQDEGPFIQLFLSKLEVPLSRPSRQVKELPLDLNTIRSRRLALSLGTKVRSPHNSLGLGGCESAFRVSWTHCRYSFKYLPLPSYCCEQPLSHPLCSENSEVVTSIEFLLHLI